MESVAFVPGTMGWTAPNFDSLQRECFLKLASAAVDSAGNDMSTTATTKTNGRKHRPKASTVFAAAFLAGAAAAVGVNRAFDVHLAQSVPQVESEPIFVAIRSLPKGSPVTIYDVALREWPKAMLPSTALRANTIFDNMVLRHPLQEGQPILSLQLAQVSPEPTAQIAATVPAAVEPDRVVRSTPLTPAPAFVPYEAATPIPAPATNERPQATITPAAGAELAKAEPADVESAKVEPAEAEPAAEMTPEPAAVAAAGTPEPETVAARVTNDTPNVTEVTETSPTPSEPMEVASAAPVPEPAPTVATTKTSAEPSMGEPVPAKPVAPTATAPKAPTVAAGEPTPSPADSSIEEPAAAPVASVAEEKDQSAEPTLASTNKPTSVAPAVEPVDVTATVLAEAAARQAEAANAAEEPATMLESPKPETIAESTASPSAQEKPAAAVTPTPASQQVMRYLVVPERIALQVDHSFTRPQPPAAVKPLVQPTNKSQGVRRLPEASTTADRTRSNQSAATQRSNRQPAEQLQAAAGKIPQALSRQQPASRIEQQAATDQDDANEPMLRSLFPKLSAGLTAMGQEWREFRGGSRQPASNQERAAGPAKTSSSQRSAARPQQSR